MKSWLSWLLPLLGLLGFGAIARENGKQAERNKNLKEDLERHGKGTKISANNRRKYDDLEGNAIPESLNSLR